MTQFGPTFQTETVLNLGRLLGLIERAEALLSAETESGNPVEHPTAVLEDVLGDVEYVAFDLISALCEPEAREALRAARLDSLFVWAAEKRGNLIVRLEKAAGHLTF